MNKKIIVMLAMLLAGTIFTFAQTETMAKENSNPAERPVETGTKALIKTTMGDITILLYDDTPAHRDNFIKIAKEGVYDGTLFHRVIKDFMIQAGDPDSKTAVAGQQLGSGDMGYTVPAEINYPRHYHKYGALSAARLPDQVNPDKNSSGSQFYIVTGKKYVAAQIKNLYERQINNMRQMYFRKLVNLNKEKISAFQSADDREGLAALRQELVGQTMQEFPETSLPQYIIDDYQNIGGTPFLDGDYTVFGEVLDGMDVAEKIQNVEKDVNDRPLEDVRILSVTIL